MDAKLRYKAKKIKIVFFDIDDTLRNSKTGFIPTTIPTVFKQFIIFILISWMRKETYL
ncbi:HAD superfamily hydrolase [Streptococcus pneumoniae]|nr:HAD superfamily hydrolase [Streptococcus pneumoniae]